MAQFVGTYGKFLERFTSGFKVITIPVLVVPSGIKIMLSRITVEKGLDRGPTISHAMMRIKPAPSSANTPGE